MGVSELADEVKAASSVINLAGSLQKNKILLNIKQALIENEAKILKANCEDIESAKKNGLRQSFIDRLSLNSSRIIDMATSIDELIRLDDPIGEVISGRVLQNGLRVERVRVPLGVVGIIYEARPNVTVEAATVCIKSGNAVLLRGGSDALKTNMVLVDVMKSAIKKSGFNPKILGFVENTSRQSAVEMMGLRGVLDVLIPRGSAGLIQSVALNSKVAVIETGTGNCHIYVDEFADVSMAVKIVVNAKVSRPWVCNAAESLLINEDVASKFLKLLEPEFERYGVGLVGCEKTRSILPKIAAATESDYFTEFLDFKMSVRVVEGVDEAIDHINRFSSHHSEAIVTENYGVAKKFLKRVDSAVVYVNASTRFTDGFELGLGSEIGISTQKLHARGPMGLEALTTFKFIVCGNGQVR